MKAKQVEAEASEGEEGEDEYYDEMEYGDELNDAEESNYKKERQQEIA